MTRGGVDEGRCKPQDTDDDGADDHSNVEPANLLGVCAPLGLLLLERPGLACAEDTTFHSGVNVCPARQRSFNKMGLLAKYRRAGEPTLLMESFRSEPVNEMAFTAFRPAYLSCGHYRSVFYDG